MFEEIYIHISQKGFTPRIGEALSLLEVYIFIAVIIVISCWVFEHCISSVVM